MDIISRAMEKEQHLCDGIKAEKQRWDEFNECVRGKKLFLFGTGGGTCYFLRNYGRQMSIAGVVDNDVRIQGQKFGTCCEEAWQTEWDSLIICDPEVLRQYSAQDIVVLITNMNSYHAMLKQMERLGIENRYVLLMMEADKRKNLTDDAGEDIGKIRNDYIDRCCQQDIEEKKIVMLIGVYGSHARQITKALLKKRNDLDIVWIVNDMCIEAPGGVRLIYARNWKNYVYEMETSRIWIFDDIISPLIRKRENQIYIQVKHWSSITLKKFYLDDRSPVLTSEVEADIKFDGARMDYLFSGSEFDEKSFKSGFMFQGENVRVGSARSDILFDMRIKEKVMDHFGLEPDAKICLYVPTYRLEEVGTYQNISIVLDMNSVLNVLRQRWGGEWFLLVRLHPSLIFENNIIPDSKYIINARRYLESEELVAASDIMITDYSSIMFEAAYKKEPVFLFAPDRQSYIGRERDLLIDYNTLPFPVAESNEELQRNIIDFEIEKYKKGVTEFLEEYGVCEDGHASERAAEHILKLLT